MMSCLLSWLFINNATAKNVDTLDLGTTPTFNIGDYLYWLATQDTLELEEAQALFADNQGQKLGETTFLVANYTLKQYWFKFSIKNSSKSQKDYLFALNSPYLNEVQFHVVRNGQPELLSKTGTWYPFNTRPLSYFDFVLPIALPPGESATYYVLSHKLLEIYNIKPELIAKDAFEEKELSQYGFIGIVIGIMLFNVVINLFLGFTLKDKIHFWYVCYVMCSLMWLMSSIGIDFQFLYPSYPEFFKYSQRVFGVATIILMGQLAVYFLRLNDTKGPSYYFLNIVGGIAKISIAMWVFFVYVFSTMSAFTNVLSNIILVAVSLICLGIFWGVIERIRQGYKPAWFYLIAMLYLSYSIVMSTSKIIITGDVSVLYQIPNDLQLGLVIETICIFLGIIYRYNLYKNEAQQLVAELAKQRLNTVERVLRAQEEERKRIAQDIHDDIGATLSSLLLHVSNMPAAMRVDAKADMFYERSIAITKKAVQDLRVISHDLIPKEFLEMGLFEALTIQIQELNAISDIAFEVQLSGDQTRISEFTAINIYRMVNELINNAIKHSKGTKVYIDVAVNDTHATILVEDNGVGITEENYENGIGFKNITSRVKFLNGTWNIDQNKNGTTVIIEIPIN